MNDDEQYAGLLSLPQDETDLRSDEFLQKLEALVNGLIINNFEKLVQLLYRIDVNEAKLKAMLADNTNEDAAKIIAALIIERQLQKIKSRAEFKSDNNSTEERW